MTAVGKPTHTRGGAAEVAGSARRISQNPKVLGCNWGGRLLQEILKTFRYYYLAIRYRLAENINIGCFQ
jgi:hypothetical protein